MVNGVQRTAHAADSAALCELGLLGVRAAGRWDAVRGQRTTTFLAALGLARSRGVRTDELVELIWPTPDRPATARQSLANIALRARRAYCAGFVESMQNGYRLGPNVASDRERFVVDVTTAGDVVADAPDRALELVDHALSLWRGEPWLGIERPVGVEGDRAHLLRVRSSALRIRAAALTNLDQGERALPFLREIVAADPFDETSRYHLVRNLTRLGQRTEALAAIREAYDLFATRGLVLDAALVDFEQQLLSSGFRSVAALAPLPEQLTGFVGREHEVEELAVRLRSSRLVTLHGIGGSGKTRLAIRVASEVGGNGGAGFVGLASARSRNDVEVAFARSVGLPSNRLDGLDRNDRLEVLTSAASASAALLVVDNCEHVLAETRRLIAALLQAPGRLRVLATSRVPLEIAGEHRYPIPRFSDGMELFRRRAAERGVLIGSDAQADGVADICDLVDHLPLGIEIAAAQTPYRAVQEIANELADGMVLRDTAQPDSRHETMVAMIRWSHELLDGDAENAFVRLGVFVTPFQHDDAASVIESDDVRGVLDTLVRSSLLERNEHDGLSTYRLAVPVQQFCAAELERSGATTDVLIALADWLLDFTDRPYGDVWWRLCVIDELTPRLPTALSTIDALREVGRTNDATRLAARLGGTAHLFGPADVLIEALTALWPDCTDQDAVADALVALTICGDAARDSDVLGRSLGLLDSMEGPAGRRHRVFVHCWNVLWLSWAARLTTADYGPAREELRQARGVAEALESPVNRAQIEMWHSAIDLLSGDWASAEAAARRALADSAGTKFDVNATSCLCHARLHTGDPQTALHLALGHPARDLDVSFGDRLGLVAAIARVQTGNVDAGLSDLVEIHEHARRAPFAAQQDDATIAVAYVAHLLGREDLTRQILDTGVIGYGPWIGYLVPKMCRDLDIPTTGYYAVTSAERRRRSDHYGASGSLVLDQLLHR